MNDETERRSGDPETAEASADAAAQHDDHETYGARRPSLSTRALKLIAVLVTGAVGALWLAPKVAPSLPAPVAELLSPPTAVTQADLEALREELSMGLDGAPARGSAADGGALEDAVAPLRAALTTLQARQGSGEDGDALAARLEATEAALAQMAARLEAAGEDDRPDGPSAATVVKLEAIVTVVESLQGEISALTARMDAVETEVAEATETMRAEVEAAAAAAAEAERSATLDGGFAALRRAMASGEAFPEALAPLEALGEPAPAPLAEASRTGLPTQAALATGLIDASREGLAAWEAETSTGLFGRALAGLTATLRGVPTEATDGEGPEAALGLAAERMAAGDVAGALAATQTLPDAATEAMADWMAAARRVAAAEAAAADWRAALEAREG